MCPTHIDIQTVGQIYIQPVCESERASRTATRPSITEEAASDDPDRGNDRDPELAARYGEAWNSQDLDAIMDLHTDDSVFVAHAAGSVPAEGREAVREAFAGYLALLPDINFAERALQVGDDHWVLESTMSGTVAQRDRGRG